MAAADSPDELRAHEQILVLLDEFPMGAAYRIAIGWLLVPLSHSFPANVHGGLSLAWWFLGILVALRLLPVVLRRVLPFPQRVAAVWADRRQLARRFDSYQWRKLIWFGVGLAAYALASSQFDGASVALTLFCILGGALGALAWRLPRAVTYEKP